MSFNVSSSLFCANHPAMGTEFSLYVYADSQEDVDAIVKPVFEEIDRVEHLLSNYRENSELSRINREAANADVITDPETFRFLETCFEWSARSKGAFDITVGKLMKAWGFFGAKGAVPSEDQLHQVSSQVGRQDVELDRTRRAVRFLSPGIELDPGGIGKGYAVDCAVKVLRARRVSSALLSAGSSTIYALGTPVGEAGWKIRVPAPGREDCTASTVILRDTSLSTANYSEKHFVHQGHLYGAIMDPRTLRPVEGILQVTAISPSATDSDALSNALFVLGSTDRNLLLDQRPDESALVILEDQLIKPYEATRWPAEVTGWHCAEMMNAREN